MTVCVMLHGGAHGAWCWERMTAFLNVPMLAIDLPGRGRHPAPLERQTGATFIASAKADILSNNLQDIILVAHSMGGITAVGLMEALPGLISHVVFVACPIPEEGQSIGQFVAGEQMSKKRSDWQKRSSDGTVAPSLVERLYHDLSPQDTQYCTSKICPESMAVVDEPVSLTGLQSDIPRTFIKTTEDRVLTSDIQDRSIAIIPNVQIRQINTGHTPMFAAPEKLARMIMQAGGGKA